ncbi:MAG: TonB family protein [Aquificaceae bacterium]|nr:TonB family protein [Aquificaceae bacterium]MDW8097108.1 TonB family protein [Aquificaceae bacterium]
MASGEKLEFVLNLGVSLLLNLVLFTLLSAYLLVRLETVRPTPIQVYVESLEEVKFAGGRERSVQTEKKGKERVEASPTPAGRQRENLPVPAKEEPSLLRDIEQRIRGKERESERQGIKSPELGDILAVVSPSGVGLSSAGRGTVYIPPLPRIASEEPLSPLKVKVWVEPSGAVLRVQVVQRSGSPEVDQKMVEFVKGIRFEAIEENTVQTGVITFKFRGG